MGEIRALRAFSLDAPLPAGTYYARLHGLNDAGAGSASFEVRIVVP